MDHKDLSGAHVIVHELAICAEVKALARGTLKVAENFHDDRSGFGAEGFVRIDVRDAPAGLRPGRFREKDTR